MHRGGWRSRDRDRRDGTPSSQALGRAPLAPKGAVNGISGRISKAGSTQELLCLAATHSASLNHIRASNLWNTLGKQRDASAPRHKEEVRLLLRRSIELLESCEARNLSNIAHGLAKCRLVGLDVEAGTLFDAIAAAAVLRLHEFNPQELADMVWAFATGGHKAPALLDAIATETVPRLREFEPQALASTAWAFATAGRATPALLDAIAAAAMPRLRDFRPQDLANTAWAFATADHKAPALLDAVATEAVLRLRDFNPQDLANTAWAFATAGCAAPALLDAIATAAALRLRDFTPQHLANMAWAFATAGRAAPALLDAIATAAVLRLRDYKPQELASTAWAFATVRQRAPILLDTIATEAAPRLRDFTPQALANTAWAFATADHVAPALFDSDAFVQLCAAERSFVPEDLRQLHQWQLWREERGATWPPLPPELAQRCRDAFSSEDDVASKLQLDVVASLLALGLAPREEVRTDEGYSLDVVVLYGAREVAIEVDGPSHFCGRTPVVTGATALKRPQLRAAGRALLPVPYWEWDALGSNAAAKQEYLRAALQQVLPEEEAQSLAAAKTCN